MSALIWLKRRNNVSFPLLILQLISRCFSTRTERSIRSSTNNFQPNITSNEPSLFIFITKRQSMELIRVTEDKSGKATKRMIESLNDCFFLLQVFIDQARVFKVHELQTLIETMFWTNSKFVEREKCRNEIEVQFEFLLRPLCIYFFDQCQSIKNDECAASLKALEKIDSAW